MLVFIFRVDMRVDIKNKNVKMHTCKIKCSFFIFVSTRVHTLQNVVALT